MPPRVVFQPLLFLPQYSTDFSEAVDLFVNARAFVSEQSGAVSAVDVAGA